MSIHLVTGHTGSAHVTSNDVGSFHACTLTGGMCVLDKGEKFAAAVLDNNTIRIKDGDLLMQGRHVRQKPGEYTDVTLENGEFGKKRIDLIVLRYSIETTSGVESAALTVIKGASDASSPAAPAYRTGSIEEGDTVDMPLYSVALDGLSVTGTTKLFGEFAPIGTLSSALEAHKADKANPHGVTTTQIGAAKSAHAHGNLTSGGAIGSAADLPVMTGDEGKLTAVSPAAAREKLGLAKVAATGSYADLTNRPAALTIDAAVTATGANPVTGKAVADYALKKDVLVLTTTDPGAGSTSTYPDGTVICVYE